MATAAALRHSIRHNLRYTLARYQPRATRRNYYEALVLALRNLLTDAWMQTQQQYYARDVKRVYYLSAEYMIGRHLEKIRDRGPQIAVAFRDRLLDRVRTLLGELDVEIDRDNLIREVSIFAERSDIAEEVVRLATHLDHFQEIMKEPESPGRKLEFLTQEMFREANTIGSKASDVDISREVVEIKGTLEKVRELIQNIE